MTHESQTRRVEYAAGPHAAQRQSVEVRYECANLSEGSERLSMTCGRHDPINSTDGPPRLDSLDRWPKTDLYCGMLAIDDLHETFQ
jgi:hypothetical protein